MTCLAIDQTLFKKRSLYAGFFIKNIKKLLHWECLLKKNSSTINTRVPKQSKVILLHKANDDAIEKKLHVYNVRTSV